MTGSMCQVQHSVPSTVAWLQHFFIRMQMKNSVLCTPRPIKSSTFLPDSRVGWRAYRNSGRFPIAINFDSVDRIPDVLIKFLGVRSMQSLVLLPLLIPELCHFPGVHDADDIPVSQHRSVEEVADQVCRALQHPQLYRNPKVLSNRSFK